AHLGVGIVATLSFVSREAGVKFFRFNVGLAAILIAIGLAFRAAPQVASTADTIAIVALWLSEAAIVVYWATVGRMLASIRPALMAVGKRVGAVAIVVQAVALVGDRGLPSQALTIASFLSSAALL